MCHRFAGIFVSLLHSHAAQLPVNQQQLLNLKLGNLPSPLRMLSTRCNTNSRQVNRLQQSDPLRANTHPHG